MRVVFLIFTCSLFAQQETTIRLDVQQVLVPAVVTDNKGHHVAGLHASDFRILEDGVPQKIAAFSSDTAASVNDIGALSKADAVSKPAAARHTFVICIDTLHTSPANAARVREALENLFAKEKSTDAQYVMIGIGRQMRVLQTATTNPLAIMLKLRSPAFQEMLGGLDASAMSAQLNNLRSRMEQFCKQCACAARSRQGCDAETETLKQSVDTDAARWTDPVNGLEKQFTQVVEELAKLSTGRTLILVSDGFNVNPTREFYALVSAYLPGRSQFRVEDSKEVDPLLQEALKITAERNVAIYTLDSRGASAPSLASNGPMDASAGAGSGGSSISGRSSPSVRTATMRATPGQQANPFSSTDSETMEQLARATGGVYFHGGSDMLKQFRSALADGREYYTLAYVPTNSARDGKFRHITVEVVDRKMNVRAKLGYWPVAVAQ